MEDDFQEEVTGIFLDNYDDVDDEDDFYAEDIKDLHNQIHKVTVTKSADEVDIHFELKNGQKFTVEMERGSDGAFVQRWDWYCFW